MKVESHLQGFVGTDLPGRNILPGRMFREQKQEKPGIHENLMNFHISNRNDVTLVVSSKEYIIPYGTCTLNKKGNLQNIIEKPKLDFFVNI